MAGQLPSERETLVLYRKRAGEKAMQRRECPDGALSIQPFEGSRVTTLWDLNREFCAGGELVNEKDVWDGWRSGAEEVIGA
jgi:hypothetical protein